ncbi:MAG: alpha/beta fold hydrolase [Alphaproteobacteria bacterium]|nr:alpha/beta fold hydrolase [Alphaproteobacteria bacterium]
MNYCFDDFEVDGGTFELRHKGVVRHIEPLVLGLILFLCENRTRVLSRDELVDRLWDGRSVSDSAISSCVKSARKALGDSGERQAYIRTVHGRGYRFVADLTAPIPDQVSISAENPSDRTPDPISSQRTPQEVRFCTTSDGVGLAYAVTGEGVPIIKVATWMSHIEHDWHSPIWSHLLRALMQNNCLVRYDERGNGLSDWEIEEFSLEKFVSDLETVIDAAGLDRFVLFGLSQGCAISAAYAARHLERVRGMILYGGYSRGWKKREMKIEAEQEEALLTLVRHGWGRDNPAFRQVFTSLFVPDATAEQMLWYNELQRISTTGENAARIEHALGTIDVSDLLPNIATPTLVLHTRDDAVVPFSEGRRLAKLLPNARFVTLEGRNHMLLETEPAWPRFLDEVRFFLNSLPKD